MIENIVYIITAIFIGMIFLLVYMIYHFRKLKSSIALDDSDLAAELNDRINRKHDASLKSISELRSETPILSIRNNEAYLHTRDDREIHRYELTKKK